MDTRDAGREVQLRYLVKVDVEHLVVLLPLSFHGGAAFHESPREARNATNDTERQRYAANRADWIADQHEPAYTVRMG